jgi:predicted nucleotidyltransferase
MGTVWRGWDIIKLVMATITTLPSTLDEVVSRLAKGLQAERIYLFGSQAAGLAERGSDYDLLVVVPRSNLPRHQREAISYDLLWGLTVPVDVIVLTHAEFQRLAQVKTSLASTAKTNGILIYGESQD